MFIKLEKSILNTHLKMPRPDPTLRCSDLINLGLGSDMSFFFLPQTLKGMLMFSQAWSPLT